MFLFSLLHSHLESIDDLEPTRKSSETPGVASSDVSDADDGNGDQTSAKEVATEGAKGMAAMTILGPVIEAFRKFFGENQLEEPNANEIAQHSQISLGDASASLAESSKNASSSMDFAFFFGQGQQKVAYAVTKGLPYVQTCFIL